MRPPLCDVCDADVDPAHPASLVSCVREADDPGLGGLPGHPAHQLWLCEAHRERGAALGASRTAAEVVAALREHPESDTNASGLAQRLAAARARIEASTVACTPIALDDAVDVLRRAFDRLSEEHDLARVEPERTEAREWTPTDGAEPPWCPYVDRRRALIARDGVELELAEEYAHWNDDELARASATLSLRMPSGGFAFAAHTQGATDEHLVRQATVTGDAPPWLLDAFGVPQPR